MDKKFTFKEPTQEEINEFKKGFEELLNKLSMIANIVPQFKPSKEVGEYAITTMISLQKKVEVVEKDSIVSPYNPDEPSQTPA